MTEQEILDLVAPLHSGLTNLATIADRPQFLAHYTSLEVLEKIMQHDELWFSHPFFMNDLQEMRFGIVEGYRSFDKYSRTQEFRDACGTDERARKFVIFFGAYYAAFEQRNHQDIYVFCLSEHNDKTDDGLLSMWRGYGDNGDGAALIFNTEFLKPRTHSPLYVGKILYETDDMRKKWLDDMFRAGMAILKENHVSDDDIVVFAGALFQVVKLFALLSKHKDFGEEHEWRIIYFPERDKKLTLLTSRLLYFIGKRGIEPKLKFKLEPLALEPRETWTFHSILYKVILGPSLSSDLASRAVCKMLATHGKIGFVEKLRPSTIPLRSYRR